MALTDLQRRICRLLADERIARGESYVAGASALNELIGATRISSDLDPFHDTDAALEASWSADVALLSAAGFDVHVLRTQRTFVEAEVAADGEAVRLEWARDSAYRFFPLQVHPDLGLTLHPFDLATNKVLALVGRLEVRDWIDVIASDARVQPLGYLAWAACAKDPGFGPGAILEQAGRSARYSADEVAGLIFDGDPPDAATLAAAWHRILALARQTITLLPPEELGTCVLDAAGRLLRSTPADLERQLAAGAVRHHHGSIGGALPRIIGV